MDYIVEGGKRLRGSLQVCGAKNCALALLGASVLTDDEVVLTNCPQIEDVDNMLSLLNALGKKVVRDGTVVSVSGCVTSCRVPAELSKLLRGSVLVLGSLVSRFGEAIMPSTGGCSIGSRPIDIHLDGLRKMGVQVDENNVVSCYGKLHGCCYKMRFPSVGATENLLCAAVLAEGTTTLCNCALEPEVVALENMLQSMGANLRGIGTDCVTISGVPKLHGVSFSVIPDRIVASTYLACCVAAGGKIEIFDCFPGHLSAFLAKLQRFEPTVYQDAIVLEVNGKVPDFGSTVTAPYPNFPTDTQQILMSLCALSAGGRSFITEKLFENRLMHNADQLKLMGANICVENETAIIDGRPLHGANVAANDLRGGAGLVVAALGAEGVTQVSGAQHVLRGYCDFAENLRSVGAEIVLRYTDENYFD